MRNDNGFNWYKKYIPICSILLGVIAIIIAQFAGIKRTTGLFSIIALGPIISGIVAYLRYAGAKDVKQTVRVIIEASWILFSFGLGYLVMAPSSYYSANTWVMILIILDALLLVGLGLSSLIYFAKKGYSLTP